MTLLAAVVQLERAATAALASRATSYFEAYILSWCLVTLLAATVSRAVGVCELHNALYLMSFV
jgi:hypothetical protein